MKVKIFWKEQCANCPPAKALGKKLEGEKGFEVSYYDIKEAGGLAESVMYDVMSTPSIIVCDENDKEIASWRVDVPKLSDIKNIKK
ncbi:thioredoxin family protein [Candidatus Woesearchaeota archaeon]|nr:thioredoxin family protein [Candidatus Woesearchaeota archaeon]